ncbi:J protein JJJ2 [Abrus precatorius]|uniref:J protein JJJ2 n=1 Tax=Abrus precatorius TaxID=3816 RepID=A0A8B8LXF8_ABRPR|nr:J protein JJJ2 [Abrus precatorius]
MATTEAEAEALRLKAMTEAKFKSSKNAKSALKYAKRAQRLAPHLAGVSETVTSLTVLAATDWYTVLGVEPFSNTTTIRKHYKNLALLLHPDKNSHVASEEAFKLVGEAFHFLSDRVRRRNYDAELRQRIEAESETFWTACSTCRLLHQFERRYLGQNLVCPSCDKSFKAVEAVQSDESGEARVRSRRLGLKERKGTMGSEKSESLRGKVGGDEVGNEREGRLRKRMRSVGEVLERSKAKRVKTGEEMMTLAEFQNEVKRKAMQKKLKEKEKEEEDRTEKRSNQEGRLRGLKNNEGLEVGEVRSLRKSVKPTIKEKHEDSEKRKGLRVGKPRDSSGGELEVMAVVDSDFYDFDTDRVERSFKKGQVWAVYDDDDGMPRHYALIDETVSVNPFEVKISWLDLQNNGDGKIVSRNKTGFHVSCGRFKVVNRKASINSVNIFSHVVDCDRAAREVYKVYPKKGSVWALYGEATLDAGGRNFTQEDKRCYDIVVFLTSYSEINGLSMAYLEKVDGYKTVFKRQEKGSHAIRFLGKDDMWLVSHQIPARKLPCDETPELLKDCWELDPASLPSDLLTIGGIDN